MSPGAEWLAWFVRQPQERCEHCRVWNEVGPLASWPGNCWHARAALAGSAER